LEILPTEFELAVTLHEVLQRGIQALGYRFVALDLGGFRSGSLNEGLEPNAAVSQIPVVNLFPAN
jgi:PP-loop superfamily ATP-utilizing enzyme